MALNWIFASFFITGCCACFNYDRVQRLLKLENPAVLLMGIGFKQEGVNRRVHHKNPEFVFPTMPKQDIEVVHYK